MGRGIAFQVSEDAFLVEYAENNTAKQLFFLHELTREKSLWPKRSIKSLARRVERLREEGKIGQRSEEARRKALYNRD